MISATTDKSPGESEKSFQQAVPDYLRIYGFDVLNLGAYYCAAGPALGLYIKYLGGSTTYMGLVMACMPACQLLQIFVAPHLERWGIKKIMVASLLMRNIMHFLLAMLPFLAGFFCSSAGDSNAGFFAQPTALLLIALFVVMLGFDLCQGLGFSGWMTWVNWLVPEKYRGRYFAFEQMMNNVGQIGFSAVAGWILGAQGSHFNYGSIFLMGAVCGGASLLFLRKVPAIPKKTDKAEFRSLNLSWIGLIWGVKPFRRMMYVICAHQLMLSVGYFFIYFQKDSLHLTDRFIMVMTTVGIAGGVLSVYIWGNLADRFGSKPVMALAYYLIMGVAIFWVGLGLGLPLSQAPLLLLVQFLYVAGLQGYVVTNMRYVLGSLPSDRMLFGTIFYNLVVQVATMLGAMFWGRFLDLEFLKNLNVYYSWMHIDRFTIVFICMLLLSLVARFCIHRLSNSESGATSLTVAWFAICQDAATRYLTSFAAFGLASLPVSYVLQPDSLKEELGLGGYCAVMLQGTGWGITPESRLFLVVVAVFLVLWLLLCFTLNRWPKKI